VNIRPLTGRTQDQAKIRGLYKASNQLNDEHIRRPTSNNAHTCVASTVSFLLLLLKLPHMYKIGSDFSAALVILPQPA